MRVKIKKLHPEAKIPKYAKPGDAGLDLVAVARNWMGDGCTVEYRTGISLEIPDGFVGLVFPRSSIKNHSLVLANAVGVIDSGYRGEVKCYFKYHDMDDYDSIYQVGDKIAQLIIMFYPKVQFDEVQELETSERGEGGFGSTGV